MQILNFTEPLIKPALQDKSKCTTFRKAWDWLDEGQNKKACWREQTECRHKVGALETIMWKQRGKNNVCENCVKSVRGDCDDYCPPLNYDCFSKVFGVGKILQTPKVWMYSDRGGAVALKYYNTNERTLDVGEVTTVSRQDGFRTYADFSHFFVSHYPIIKKEWMPFWKIGWEWQK